MNPSEILKEMRKTTVELRRNTERQMELSSRGKLILRNQFHVLCKALQQLKRRSELGHFLAGEIWNCMIDGITEQLPPEFFVNHSENYFWERDEVLTEDELALKLLLDQALQRRKEKADGTKNKVAQAMAEAASNTKKFSSIKCGQQGHVCLFEGTAPLLGPGIMEMESTRGKGKVGKQKGKVQRQGRGVREEELLGYLINVIKVAIDTTDVGRWEWKKDDQELKAEMHIFHQGLKVAMQLFEEIHRNPNLESLINAIEKISFEAAAISEDERVVPICSGKCYDSTSSSSSTPSLSSSEVGTAAESEEFCDEHDDDFEEDENEDDVFCPMLIPSAKRGKSKPCIGGTVTSTSTISVETVNQHYVVRQFKTEEGKRKRRPLAFKCTPCEHHNPTIPPAHARDWRKEGYLCNCGKKFTTSKEFDRHLTLTMESLVLACSKCNYNVNRRCCMEKHKKEMHDKLTLVKSSQRLYKCRMKCGQAFESKKEMLEHISNTGRQCVHKNAGKLPLRTIPTNPKVFMNMLKGTLQRSGLELNVERLEAILSATNEDTRLAQLKKEAKVRLHVMKVLEEAKSVEEDDAEENDGDEKELTSTG